MSKYRRNYVLGGTYFFTVVTDRRRQFLTTPSARECLRHAIRSVRNERPFTIVAICLLPDHLHCVWTLPPDDSDYSTRWRLIKDRFTKSFRAGNKTSIWQPRYWEHTCRDEEDLKRCVDYIHWNPVKHKLVRHVCDYPWSSFHRFVKLGEYTTAWGDTDPCQEWDQPE
jgi:putative transposase